MMKSAQRVIRLKLILYFVVGAVAPSVLGTAAPYSLRSIYLSPEAVAHGSSTIVVAEVQEVFTTVIRDTVYTNARCLVLDTLAGVAGAEIIVRQAGGSADGLTTFSGPLAALTAGEKWILSLTQPQADWWAIYGLTQGAFRISGNTAIRSFHGLHFVQPPPVELQGLQEFLPLQELLQKLSDGLAGKADEAKVEAGATQVRTEERGAGWAAEKAAAIAAESFPANAKGSVIEHPASQRPLLLTGAGSKAVAANSAHHDHPETASPLPRVMVFAGVFLAAAFAALLAMLYKRRTKLLLLISAAGLAAVFSASGYVLYSTGASADSALRWDLATPAPAQYFSNGKLQYRIITAGTHAVAQAEFRQAVMHAFQTWEDVPSAIIQFVRGPDIVAAPYDEGFSIGFSDSSANTQYGSNMAGATGLTLFTYRNGFLVDADICMNATYNWSDDKSTGNDFESTMLHEVGHAVGLGHTPHVTSCMSYLGLWSFGENNSWERSLCSDDVLALAVLYPDSAVAAVTGAVYGSITVDGMPVHKAQIGIFDADNILLATVLSKHGEFAVDGLPAGVYTLRAFPTFEQDDMKELNGLYMKAGTLNWTDTEPTAFRGMAVGPEQIEVVSGQITQTVLTVAPGLPVQRVRGTWKADSGWFSSRALRMYPGQSARLALVGRDFPMQGDKLQELSFTGAGYTIADLAFSGETGALQADWPEFGDSAVTFDLVWDTTALPGTRALLLRNADFAEEQQLTFGIVELVQTGAAAVAPGPHNPASGNLNLSQDTAVMLQLSFTPDASEDIRIRQLTLQEIGSGSLDAIQKVVVAHDEDGDGVVGIGEILAEGVFDENRTVQIPLVLTATAGERVDFIILYEFNHSLMSGSTYQVSVTDISSTGLQSGDRIVVTSLPLPGEPLTAATSTFVLDIAAGWNLISLPHNPSSTDPAYLFAAVDPILPLWGWSNGAYSDRETVEALHGYWLYARTADSAVSTFGDSTVNAAVTLDSGWNLYGPKTTCAVPAEVTSVWSWDPVQRTYLPVDATGMLQPGRGYWLYTAAPATVQLGE